MRPLILTSVIVLLFATAQGLVVETEKRAIKCLYHSCCPSLDLIANYGSAICTHMHLRWHHGTALNVSGQLKLNYLFLSPLLPLFQFVQTCEHIIFCRLQQKKLTHHSGATGQRCCTFVNYGSLYVHF